MINWGLVCCMMIYRQARSSCLILHHTLLSKFKFSLFKRFQFVTLLKVKMGLTLNSNTTCTRETPV